MPLKSRRFSAAGEAANDLPVGGLKLLAIDTATEVCSVAVNLGGDISQRRQLAPRGHSRLILGMAFEVLQQCGVRLGDLDAIAVDAGPGSFTGLRIGLGVAQGLAYAAGLKVIPVISLEALAYAAGEAIGAGIATVTTATTDATANAAAVTTTDNAATIATATTTAATPPYILPAIDARMQQIYYALYHAPPAAIPAAIIPPTLADFAPLPIPPHAPTGTGSAWDNHPQAMRAAAAQAPRWLPEQHPEAKTISQLAQLHGLQRATCPLQLAPTYLRNQVTQPR